jgi:hypothetical protein
LRLGRDAPHHARCPAIRLSGLFLALATFGFVTISPRVIEPLIALTIVVAAVALVLAVAPVVTSVYAAPDEPKPSDDGKKKKKGGNNPLDAFGDFLGGN